MEGANSNYELKIEKEASRHSMETQRLSDHIKSLEDALEWQKNKEQISRSKHDLKKSEGSHFFSSSGDVGLNSKYWKG